MWLLRDRVPSPQMGKQRGSTQQMVGAREGNKRRPRPPFLAAAFTKSEKELLVTFSLGAALQKSTMCSRSFPLKEGFARQPCAERPWHFKASRSCPNTINTSPTQVNFKEFFTEIPLYSAPCSHTMTKNAVTRQNR